MFLGRVLASIAMSLTGLCMLSVAVAGCCLRQFVSKGGFPYEPLLYVHRCYHVPRYGCSNRHRRSRHSSDVVGIVPIRQKVRCIRDCIPRYAIYSLRRIVDWLVGCRISARYLSETPSATNQAVRAALLHQPPSCICFIFSSLNAHKLHCIHF